MEPSFVAVPHLPPHGAHVARFADVNERLGQAPAGSVHLRDAEIATPNKTGDVLDLDLLRQPSLPVGRGQR